MGLNHTIANPARAAARAGVRRTLLGLALGAAGSAGLAVEHGFGMAGAWGTSWALAQVALGWGALALAGDVRALGPVPGRWRTGTGRVGEPVLLAALALALLGVGAGAGLAVVAVTVALLIRLNAQLARAMANPGLLFPGSFLAMIGVSAGLLLLPASTPRDDPIGVVDAVFTATSAVCVTGLVVRDTGTGFTPFGQAVIGVSIQLGGLGMMIFGSTLALLFGARLSYRENLTLSAALNEYPAHRINRFVGFIVLTTLAIEAVAAAYMFVAWPGEGLGWAGRAGMAAFHSVSAFCNAGFDLTGASMVPLRSHPIPYLGVMPLIVLGGIGFLALDDAWRTWFVRPAPGEPRRRLSTHTRLVLWTTALLLICGAVVIFVAQLKTPGVAPGQRVLDAAFMSVTARTAGFNSVPMDELAPGSRFALMALMFIGGGPGGTAGGIKTAVFAVLALAVWSTVRGRDEVEVFGRSLPDALVKKAAAVAFALAALVGVVTLTLDLIETIPFEALLFEVVSAASTTGLSLGATETIGPAGRCVLAATMFLGRVGLLAFLASLLTGGGGSGSYRYPRDSVSLG